jgi:hypothetical protein
MVRHLLVTQDRWSDPTVDNRTAVAIKSVSDDQHGQRR